MRTSIILKWLLLSAFFIFLMAFEEVTSDVTEGIDNAKDELAEATNAAFKADLKNCASICKSSPVDGNYEISEECAKCMEANFEEYRDSFLNGGLRGFQIEQKELQQILDVIDGDRKAKVYSMFGIRGYENGKYESETIFVVEKYDSNIETTADTTLYFDFTYPCPDACPNG